MAIDCLATVQYIESTMTIDCLARVGYTEGGSDIHI